MAQVNTVFLQALYDRGVIALLFVPLEYWEKVRAAMGKILGQREGLSLLN